MWNEVIHNIDRCIWTKINAYDKNMRWQQIWARDKLRQNLQQLKLFQDIQRHCQMWCYVQDSVQLDNNAFDP